MTDDLDHQSSGQDRDGSSQRLQIKAGVILISRATSLQSRNPNRWPVH